MTGIGVVGDSLTYQGGKGSPRIDLAFQAAGHDVSQLAIDAVAGRGIRGGIPVVQRWAEQGFTPGVWLIALGTNNRNASADAWRRDIGRMLDEIGPGREVHWIGLGFRDVFDERPRAFQLVLDEFQGSAQLTAHDWDDYMHDGRRNEAGLWLPSDPNGIHMTSAGYQVRNAYYAASVPVAAEGAA